MRKSVFVFLLSLLSVFLYGCAVTPVDIASKQAEEGAENDASATYRVTDKLHEHNEWLELWRSYPNPENPKEIAKFTKEVFGTEGDGTVEIYTDWWNELRHLGKSPYLNQESHREVRLNPGDSGIEDYRKWMKGNVEPEGSTYFKLVYSFSPVAVETGDKGYGFIEERGTKSNNVIRNWPVFYEMEEVDDSYRLTFSYFLPDGSILRVIKDFADNQYHFPLQETHLVSMYGVITGHLIYVRQGQQ